MGKTAPEFADAHLRASAELTIECRTGADAPSHIRHPVTIREDWTVATPHDLEAERVGVAFGGYSSCAVLVDITVPAVRASFPLLTRLERPALQHSQRGWSVVGPHRKKHCCPLAPYSEIQDAVRHTLSDSHLAHGSRAPLWQFAAVRDALVATQGFAHDVDACDGDPRALVDSDADLRELWSAGVAPRDLAALAAPAAAVGSSLSVPYFLQAAYGAFDSEWFSAVLSARPDIDTAVWLAGLDASQALGDTDKWRQWLLFGIRRHEALFAVTHDMDGDSVAAIATDVGRSRNAVAETLVQFAMQGFLLSHEHFVLFARHGVDHPQPLVKAVGELELLLQSKSGGRERPARPSTHPPDRTELAVMLAILGTRGEVVAAVGRGASSARDLPLPR